MDVVIVYESMFGNTHAVAEAIGSLPPASPGQLAAAFDTRADFRFAGRAAKGVAKRLRHQGSR